MPVRVADEPECPPHSSPALSSWDNHVSSVLDKLTEIYRQHIHPLEVAYDYSRFKPSWFAESINQRRPFVVFIGPFSTGKSTFINYLLQDNILPTGPQPVTDKFNVIMWGPAVQRLNGRTLVANGSLPFRALAQFGDAFQESFEGTLSPHPLLRAVTLVDTPGVLEAAGDLRKRRYEYTKVVKWFVEQGDLIFVMFDPSKLDAGPELRRVFKHSLHNCESKLRIVFNKADTVTAQELMRVYGCLFWNLANLVTSTEPPRVYVSSFWSQPYRPYTDHQLFEAEKADLLYELTEIVPVHSLDRRVANVIRHANAVLVHSCVCGVIRERLPWCCGVERAQAREMACLPDTFGEIATREKLASTDFENGEAYRLFLDCGELQGMPPLSKMRHLVDRLRQCINADLPNLLQPIHDAPVEDPRKRKLALLEHIHRQQDGGLYSPVD